MDSQDEAGAGAAQEAAPGMKVIHAKGLEHHMQSGVTTRAPEPGAPIAQGQALQKPSGPTQMPGMPSAVVRVPAGRDADLATIVADLTERTARLERFIMMSTGIANIGEIDAKMEERIKLAAQQQERGGKRSKQEAADAPSSEN